MDPRQPARTFPVLPCAAGLLAIAIVTAFFGWQLCQEHRDKAALDALFTSLRKQETNPRFILPEAVDIERDDLAASYQVVYSDYFFGSLDYIVRFPNGTEYEVGMTEGRDGRWVVDRLAKAR